MKGRFGTQDIQHGITDLPINIKQATQTPPVESPHLPRHISAHTTLWVKDGHTPNSTPVQQHTPNKCLKQGKACLAITQPNADSLPYNTPQAYLAATRRAARIDVSKAEGVKTKPKYLNS